MPASRPSGRYDHSPDLEAETVRRSRRWLPPRKPIKRARARAQVGR